MVERTLTLSCKLKLIPDENQVSLLSLTMFKFQSACNYISAFIESTGISNKNEIQKNIYSLLRGKFTLPSQMAISAIRETSAKFKSHSLEDKTPEFKSPFYHLVYNRDYSIKDSIFSINTLNGRIKIPFSFKGREQYFDGTWKFGTATIFIKRNKFYISLSVSKQVSIPEYTEVSTIIGVDRGIRKILAYSSDSKDFISSGGKIKQKRANLQALRKELQRKQTPSARRKIKKIGQRENRYVNNENHCFAKALVDQFPKSSLIVLEDLTGIRSATEKVRIRDRYISVSWAFDDLGKKIEYKAKQRGQEVIFVNPKYTSQRCPICGHISQSNRDKKNHRFTCRKCGYHSNDDRIGGLNLKQKGEFLLFLMSKFGIKDIQDFLNVELPEESLIPIIREFSLIRGFVNSPNEKKSLDFFSMLRQPEKSGNKGRRSKSSFLLLDSNKPRSLGRGN